MLDVLTRNWWVLLVRGLCAVVFGVMAFAWPISAVVVLALIYGAYALLDGIAALVFAIRSRHENENWWALLLVGMAGIGVGLITFAWPGITLEVLVLFVAVWSIVRGVFEIVAAIRLRRHIESEWLLALDGAVSILFGIAIFAWPIAALITLAWLIGAGAILFGILAIALSLRLRALRNRMHQQHAPPAGAAPA